MSDKTFQFELLTPETVLMRDRVREVVVPGREGYFGVMAGHDHFATTLTKGWLTAKWADKTRRYHVDGGVVQVTPDKVVVCAEHAELTEIEPL